MIHTARQDSSQNVNRLAIVLIVMCSNADRPVMRLFLMLPLCLCFSHFNAFPQNDRLSEGEEQRFDSMATAYKGEAKRVRQEREDSLFAILSHQRNESEGKLREAKRFEREADVTAGKSRTALRKEKRIQLQKARMDRRLARKANRD
jgi:hypothetical protein